MINYSHSTLAQYLEQLAAREPVPGGGSAAALTGSLGAALIEMVAQYSLGKGKPAKVEQKLRKNLEEAGVIRRRLLELTTRDAEAYLNVRNTKKGDPRAHREALKAARQVPKEICRLCQKAVGLTSFLVLEGNPYLLSDVRAANEFLLAAFASAKIMIETNQ